MKMIIIVGTRPNLIKASPLVKALNDYPNIEYHILHTGQHYDKNMSDNFFSELDIPYPEVNLGITDSNPTIQTGEMIKQLETPIRDIKPDIVVIIGDVNSTLAGAVVVSKMNDVILAHVESGERSYDRSMPEEINRIVADHLSDILFCSHYYAENNLRNEGIFGPNVITTGDLIIDNIINHENIINSKSNHNKGCVILTLHRPSNVDKRDTLKGILESINDISKDNNIIFPIHPRTRSKIEEFKLQRYLSKITVIDPLSYIDLMSLMKDSKCILTDSGGLQIESWYFGIPCITMRYNTEALETLKCSINVLVGNDKNKILEEFYNIEKKPLKRYPLWHGKAAYNMIDKLIGGLEYE